MTEKSDANGITGANMQTKNYHQESATIFLELIQGYHKAMQLANLRFDFDEVNDLFKSYQQARLKFNVAIECRDAILAVKK